VLELAAGAAVGAAALPKLKTPVCCVGAWAGVDPKPVAVEVTGEPNGEAAVEAPNDGAFPVGPLALPPKLKEGLAGVDEEAPN